MVSKIFRASSCAVLLVLVYLFSTPAFGSGFALYQASSKFNAFGGAAIGKAIDASANFANPATLTDLTNIEITVGFITEHPRGEVGVRGPNGLHDDYKMDAGLFWLPHLQLALPLPAGFTIGLGVMPEYGLGTEFSSSWPLNASCYETTVESLVVNPNLAYKITDDWSVGVGLRWLYFSFDQYRKLMVSGVPVNYELKGDNNFEGIGWQIGTKYDIFDNLSVGLVYKAPIKTTIEGKTYGHSASSVLAKGFSGDADADITLPQSVTAGINWDPVRTWHLGLSVGWTEWSEFDQLVFNIVNPTSGGCKVPTPTQLDWRDTWRGSVGSCWDFADDWSWLVSYTYDMDSTRSSQQSAMLPPCSRHILSTGFSWRVGWGIEATLSYSCVFMNGSDMTMFSRYSAVPGTYRLDTNHGFCHSAGFSLTYKF